MLNEVLEGKKSRVRFSHIKFEIPERYKNRNVEEFEGS